MNEAEQLSDISGDDRDAGSAEARDAGSGGAGRDGGGRPAGGDAQSVRELGRQVHARMDRLERMLAASLAGASRPPVSSVTPSEGPAGAAGHPAEAVPAPGGGVPAPAAPGVVHSARAALRPAWQRATPGERRWAVTVVTLLALVVQWLLPERLSPRPHWLLPVLAAVVLAGVVAANPGRMEGGRRVRWASLTVTALVSLANAWSAAALVGDLVDGGDHAGAGELLMTGGGIWLTNVIVFALWYWEWDRGGPACRAAGERPHPDFLFPQMQDPGLAPPHWEPRFVDYLYLAFTNATAFSPTDVLPMSRWAKLLMLGQSLVSLVTVALVIARAVNILG